MILVDTSVLIDFLKGRANERVSAFSEILDRRLPFGINEFICQEILQGAATAAEFDKLKEYLETIPFYRLKEGKGSFEKAAYLNIACCKSGITIRSTIDLLIALSLPSADLLWWDIHVRAGKHDGEGCWTRRLLPGRGTRVGAEGSDEFLGPLFSDYLAPKLSQQHDSEGLIL